MVIRNEDTDVLKSLPKTSYRSATSPRNVLSARDSSSSKILHSDTEDPMFDRLTSLAKRLFNVPVALVTIVDGDNFWIKSNAGVCNMREIAKAEAFCHYTFQEGQVHNVFIVEDAFMDDRFKNLRLVKESPHIRFYAGTVLIVDNVKIGSLCIIDTVARKLSNDEQSNFLDIAAAVSQLITDRNEQTEKLNMLRNNSASLLAQMMEKFREEMLSQKNMSNLMIAPSIQVTENVMNKLFDYSGSLLNNPEKSIIPSQSPLLSPLLSPALTPSSPISPKSVSMTYSPPPKKTTGWMGDFSISSRDNSCNSYPVSDGIKVLDPENNLRNNRGENKDDTLTNTYKTLNQSDTLGDDERETISNSEILSAVEYNTEIDNSTETFYEMENEILKSKKAILFKAKSELNFQKEKDLSVRMKRNISTPNIIRTNMEEKKSYKMTNNMDEIETKQAEINNHVFGIMERRNGKDEEFIKTEVVKRNNENEKSARLGEKVLCLDNNNDDDISMRRNKSIEKEMHESENAIRKDVRNNGFGYDVDQDLMAKESNLSYDCQNLKTSSKNRSQFRRYYDIEYNEYDIEYKSGFNIENRNDVFYYDKSAMNKSEEKYSEVRNGVKESTEYGNWGISSSQEEKENSFYDKSGKSTKILKERRNSEGREECKEIENKICGENFRENIRKNNRENESGINGNNEISALISSSTPINQSTPGMTYLETQRLKHSSLGLRAGDDNGSTVNRIGQSSHFPSPFAPSSSSSSSVSTTHPTSTSISHSSSSSSSSSLSSSSLSSYYSSSSSAPVTTVTSTSTSERIANTTSSHPCTTHLPPSSTSSAFSNTLNTTNIPSSPTISNTANYTGNNRNRERNNSNVSVEEIEEKKRRAAHTAVSSAALLSSMVDRDLREYNLSLFPPPNVKDKEKEKENTREREREKEKEKDKERDRDSEKSYPIPSFLGKFSRALTHRHGSISSMQPLPIVRSTVPTPSLPLKIRVLVVDDSPVLQKMMGKWLKRNCCDVTTASNGKLGLKCLREEQFDVCFMDFYMPIILGLEAMMEFHRCLNLEPSSIPGACEYRINKEMLMVGMSHSAGDNDLQLAFKHGMHFFLTKPVDKDLLNTIIINLKNSPSLFETVENITGVSDQLPRRLPALLKDHHTHTHDDKGTCTLIPTSISISKSNSNLCLSVNSSVGPSSFLRSVSDLSLDKGSYYNEYNDNSNSNHNDNNNNNNNNSHHYHNDDNSNHYTINNNDNDNQYNSSRINNNNNKNGNNNENKKLDDNKIISCTSFDALTSTTYDTTSTLISTSTSAPSLSSLTQSNQKMNFFTKKFHDSIVGTDCPVELFPVKDTVYGSETVQTKSGLMGMRAFKFASEKSKILKMK